MKVFGAALNIQKKRLLNSWCAGKRARVALREGIIRHVWLVFFSYLFTIVLIGTNAGKTYKVKKEQVV